jgi:hypothetical protein
MKRLLSVFAFLTLAAAISSASAGPGLLMSDRSAAPPQHSVAGVMLAD